MRPRFLVTGMGRSGTSWLAEILNLDDEVRVHHEPLGMDRDAGFNALKGQLDVHLFMQRREIAMRKIQDKDQGRRAYAEVNSHLRYMAPEFREYFGCPVFGLVRDGRECIRSLINQQVFMLPNYPPIQAPPASYFGKVCWYWAEAYQRLIDQGIFCYRLDRLNQSYAYFSSLCNQIGVQITKQQWAQMAGQRINAATYHETPVWDEDEFLRVAGDVYWELCE